MRILAGAALALTTLIGVSAFSAPAAEARDRDRAHHGDRHHGHGDRHRSRKGGLRIGIGDDGIYISKRKRHRHHHHHRRHHH